MLLTLTSAFCTSLKPENSSGVWLLLTSLCRLTCGLLWLMRTFVQASMGAQGPTRTHTLAPGVSETLKVLPTRKVLQHVTPGRGGIGKVQNVISLHFEGNWMPLTVSLLQTNP